jgi:2'-5' RNA ligase
VPTGGHRVFFALWPEEAVARALADAATAPPGSCAGRRLPQESLHMTLAFIGRVDAAQLRLLKEIAAQMTTPVFQVVLDQLVWWRRRRMVWAGAATAPMALDALVSNLAAGLCSAGFPVEKRPFAAHVTLMRNARCAEVPALSAPVSWPVSEFVLAESLLQPQGAVYRPLGRYPLQR